MNPIHRNKIERAVIQMFRVNMGLKSGEKALILSDVPTPKDWEGKDSSEISCDALDDPSRQNGGGYRPGCLFHPARSFFTLI